MSHLMAALQIIVRASENAEGLGLDIFTHCSIT